MKIKENRKQLVEEFEKDLGKNMDKDQKRMFLSYDRYYEAKLIHNVIKGKRMINILDYGAGPGDYGMYFVRKGFKVTFYDFPHALDFIKFRLRKEQIRARQYKFYKVSNTANRYVFNKINIAIFGEVLEHLKNPLSTLKACHKAKVRYVFTSSYPYRHGDDYWKDRNHMATAKEQMMDCRQFLEDNYDFSKFEGEYRVWEYKS